MADAAMHIGKTRSARYIALPITEFVLNVAFFHIGHMLLDF
jgi:hypothetical protein